MGGEWISRAKPGKSRVGLSGVNAAGKGWRDTGQVEKGPVMAHYQIRLTRKAAGPLILMADHASDFAAVRNARALARPGDGIEIWNGDRCVFSNPEAHTPAAGAPASRAPAA